MEVGLCCVCGKRTMGSMADVFVCDDCFFGDADIDASGEVTEPLDNAPFYRWAQVNRPDLLTDEE